MHTLRERVGRMRSYICPVRVPEGKNKENEVGQH